MSGLVIYAVGSPLVVDTEASLARSGIEIAAAVKNVEGESFLLDRTKLIERAEITDSLKALPFLVPLFTPENRRSAAEEARRIGFKLPGSLVDPSVPKLHAVDCAPGLFINCGCSIGAASSFDEFVLINRGASIGHHAVLGRFVSIGPGAVLAGQVTIADGAMIGAGAVILPKIRIGKNAIIGAGSVVVKDVAENTVVAGNPARVVRTVG